jgi:hypothetical protein
MSGTREAVQHRCNVLLQGNRKMAAVSVVQGAAAVSLAAKTETVRLRRLQ